MSRTLILAMFVGLSTRAFAQGSTIVRIEDPSGSHCINALKEEVTVHVRRVFAQKTGGLFTEDKRAGVSLTTRLTGKTRPTTGNPVNEEVKYPSVNLVTIADENRGRVSLPLEYQVASYLQLQQGKTSITDIHIDLTLAKVRGKSTFGEVLDVAGKAFAALPIPASPFTDAANKFLKFTNDAIDESTKGANSEHFGKIDLAFNNEAESDIKKCASRGKERTGAVALLLGRGQKGVDLIPITNTEKNYCFSYSSINTYELLAGARKPNGTCPDSNKYSGVANDYVMFLISAQPAKSDTLSVSGASSESKNRCRSAKLPLTACGVRGS